MGSEVGGAFSREGTRAYLWPVHADVWQKPSQYCKVIVLQLKSILKIRLKIVKNVFFILNKLKGWMKKHNRR